MRITNTVLALCCFSALGADIRVAVRDGVPQIQVGGHAMIAAASQAAMAFDALNGQALTSTAQATLRLELRFGETRIVRLQP